MHPCLRIDEIVRLIACELVTSRARATAAALACCCKGFEDPVLDVLWETQGGLIQLLGTLPEDVWNPSGWCISFRRLPTTLEWARFREYARRMRTIEEHLDLIPLQILSALQFRALSEPLFTNLKSLELRHVYGDFVLFITPFLSPRITSIYLGFEAEIPTVEAASMIAALPTLCPSLQKIYLCPMPRDLTITAAVSEMLLLTDRRALQQFHVDSPLTEEASQVICKLSNLCDLWVVIHGPGWLPTLVLPNLTVIDVECDHDHGWLEGFRRATLGKLTSITFRSESSSIDDLLEAFEGVALTTSIPATLSTFKCYTSLSWRPNYRSLLPFTQLEQLEIVFPCGGVCSSAIDDCIITDLARAMPKLRTLRLGASPCETPASVTIKGLAALAHHCHNLTKLRVHFQLAGLDPPEVPQAASSSESTMPWGDCALTDLQVGSINMLESGSTVALTLLRIFPHLDHIRYSNRSWAGVVRAIRVSKELADRSRATLETTVRS